MHKENLDVILQYLQESFPKSVVLANEPMSKHTTFRIGGPADIYVEPDFDELVPIISYLKENVIPYMVIGNGSNLLVSDAGIEGVVVALGKGSSDVLVEGNKIIAQAGAMLSSVANAAAKESLTGLEFAAGIPGSIGGAVYMNAGAYGGEIKDVLVSVKVYSPSNEIVKLGVEELDLSYRHSKLMEEGGIVLEAELELQKGDSDAIQSLMADLREKRVSKQPLNFPSAGSTFKRPEGFFAGKLIEDSGLRGYTVGGAMVSEKHCGFVVNAGGASCEDVLKLMADVDAKVFEGYGVHLEPEVRIIGRSN